MIIGKSNNTHPPKTTKAPGVGFVITGAKKVALNLTPVALPSSSPKKIKASGKIKNINILKVPTEPSRKKAVPK